MDVLVRKFAIYSGSVMNMGFYHSFVVHLRQDIWLSFLAACQHFSGCRIAGSKRKFCTFASHCWDICVARETPLTVLHGLELPGRKRKVPT